MSFTVVPRRGWNAVAARRFSGFLVEPVPEVWIHHTVTVSGPPDQEPAIMRKIQQIAFNRGFNDISYSFVVFPTGRIYEGRGWGVVGAHTEGHNSKSVGICFAGNLSAERPTPASLDACRWLIDQGKDQRKVANGARVHPSGGHRDTKATNCPGDFLYAEMPTLRRPWEGDEDMPFEDYDRKTLNEARQEIRLIHDWVKEVRGWYIQVDFIPNTLGKLDTILARLPQGAGGGGLSDADRATLTDIRNRLQALEGLLPGK